MVKNRLLMRSLRIERRKLKFSFPMRLSNSQKAKYETVHNIDIRDEQEIYPLFQ